MEEITLHGTRILVGESAGNLSRYLPRGRVIAITNPVVRACHARLLAPYETIEMGDGEASKTLETVDRLAGELIARGADRDTFILGVGGGITCDVAAFAASIYMRGCRFGLVPTTLLAQVDASVGGKNGVNYRGYKNMLGTFARPAVVLCDPALLLTLDPRAYAAGFAEVVKAALVADASLFEYLERHAGEAARQEAAVLERLVSVSIRIKAAIVEADERERGARRLLNLGHTFAHAIEKCTPLSHGEAVSVGLCMASRLSVRLGLMSEGERARVVALLTALALPVRVEASLPSLFAATRADKKKSGDLLHLILPAGIGRSEERLLPFAELEALFAGLNEEGA